MFTRRIPFRKFKSSDDAPRQGAAASEGEPSGSTAFSRGGSVTSIDEQALEGDLDRLSLRPKPTPTTTHQSLRKPDASGHDPLGMSVVYRPQGERQVDLVFVHGLGGTSRLTWSKNKDLDLFWPHKFLPTEPDMTGARILTFGYDASFRPRSRKNTTTVLDFAKDLLFEMKYAKDEGDDGLRDLEMGQRPIIFVVHSMGGLIVKEAYMQGLYDRDYERIVESISAIVFLSTPHRGTNLAETLKRILQASLVTAPKQYISELIKNSYTLQKLNEQFRHVAHKLDIVSFYETRTTAVGFSNRIMILEKDSSVLGYPGEISKPLDADHHGVCKYESRQDPLYIAVRNILIFLVSKSTPALESGKSSCHGRCKPLINRGQGNSQTQARVNGDSEIEEFLSVYGPPDDDYTFFRDRWTPGTCEWILKDITFTNWLADTSGRARLLWIYGNAASGKSVLSSFIIDHLIRNGKQCQYFFIRFGDQHKRSVHLLLRSIAHQIAWAIPAYGAKLTKLASGIADLKTADVRNLWQWLFRAGICAMQVDTPLYWVLDGVDESDSPQTIVKLLSDLAAYAIPLRLLLVSRKTQELFSAFQRLGKGLQMDCIETEGNLDDFRCFIEHEMDDVARNESYRSGIASRILERANGNFLWVHLAVQKINRCISLKDIEDVMEQLPPGMEVLYDRMASMIVGNSSNHSKRLAHDIVAWTTCARRLMTIAELSEALGPDAPFDLQRSIGDLCGGFVVVDMEGKIAMIHETAREYLFSRVDQPIRVKKQSANELLFQECMRCFMDPSLGVKISRNQEPVLLDYAMSSWFVHLCHADATSSNVLSTILEFLQAPYVLTWIHAVAKKGMLHLLILASRCLIEFSRKRKDLGQHYTSTSPTMKEYDVFESWATDLVKIVGKFGRNLVLHPQAIYKLIPPFCPQDSIIYQQFGQKNTRSLSVSGLVNNSWGDCIGRISLKQGTYTSSVMTAGSRIAVLSLAGRLSRIPIHHASTFEELRQITYPERVLKMQLNNSGSILATYGYLTTRVWDLSTGECTKTVPNPSSRPWPHTIVFTHGDTTLLVGNDDRRLRSLVLDDNASDWVLVAEFNEQQREGTIVNSPTCMALSPDGDRMALGYRGHPVTLWEVDGPTPIARCARTLIGASFSTTAAQASGEVMELAWHPFSGEVFGLHLEGILFKWQPFSDEVKGVMTGAYKLALNRDGSLCATGDAQGTVKIFSTANFGLLYQLSSEDMILDLSFSTDSKRLYDVRGTYANIWEPSTLVRLADTAELLERSSDNATLSENLAKPSTDPECRFQKADRVTAISAQRAGSLYCYGTENGVVNLFEVGRGQVAELQRSKGYTPIEHITWTSDERLVAFADIHGKLTIKSVAASTQNGGSWKINPVMDARLPLREAGIKQLLFHPRGDKLLVYVTTQLCVISIPSIECKNVRTVAISSTVNWMCHPSSDEHLLGFGPDSLHVYGWSSLEEIASLLFPRSPPNSTTSPTTEADLWGARETITTPTLTADSTRVLIQISRPLSGTRTELHHLLLSVDAIGIALGMPSAKHNDLEDQQPTCAFTPLDIDWKLALPLVFHPRGKLIFLDQDYWVCTWYLPAHPIIDREQSSAGTRLGDFKRHYPLPADWVSFERTALCCIMSDGTLLYPRNGEVAVIQSDSLRPGAI
ncbi:MAG: hypothetical protein M1816_001273 [Peltula sp. TS41687]|nr:MAG: hypothetical protein M1816_001273 [Peltula sp. TS41687]